MIVEEAPQEDLKLTITSTRAADRTTSVAFQICIATACFTSPAFFGWACCRRLSSAFRSRITVVAWWSVHLRKRTATSNRREKIIWSNTLFPFELLLAFFNHTITRVKQSVARFEMRRKTYLWFQPTRLFLVFSSRTRSCNHIHKSWIREVFPFAGRQNQA